MRFFERLRGDVTYLRGAMRALRLTRPIALRPTHLFPDVIDELAVRYGDKPALVSDRESLSYRGLAERSRAYARWMLTQGLRKGDVVGLLMGNRPEYMAIWLGVIRAGGTVALLNTNLNGASLAHCIDLAAPKCIVVAGEMFETLGSSAPFRKSTAPVWIHGAPMHDVADIRAGGVSRIDDVVAKLANDPLSPAERPHITIEDPALFIYTSGTTGMPKAANINHFRLMLAALGFAGVMNTRPDDRMYDCLPMYHTTGGVVATGAVLVGGGTVFIREKFSAREFWDDVARHQCTLFQYIGELCRYLVNSPPHPLERTHRLRLCCGNGLRPDIWRDFQARFSIPLIVEFYAATEGNVTLFNFEGKPGAVGRIPWFLKHTFPTAIVKFDIDSEMPIRNAQGFCEKAAPGEVGEAIAKIIKDPSKPAGRFEGYSDPRENEHKILRDVFAPGDSWFRSGDLMREDADGYFYFVDRIGDTYRWKGENVSTAEIGEILCGFESIREANVYGVTVPGHEGRIGMAAIVCDPDLDFTQLRRYLATRLPDYARPIFLRLRGAIEVTATFKQKKIDLVKEGFDPTLIRDAIYFDDPRQQAYVRLDAMLHGEIVSGVVRL